MKIDPKKIKLMYNNILVESDRFIDDEKGSTVISIGSNVETVKEGDNIVFDAPVNNPVYYDIEDENKCYVVIRENDVLMIIKK